jgi:hypothetical protein
MSKLHVYVVLRRVSATKNENMGLTKKCMRFVDRDNDPVETLRRAKKTCDEPGMWRIYRSVNKRDTEIAMKQLQIQMIMHPNDVMDKVDAKWKSILMESKCKGERKFLVDIDNSDPYYQMEVRRYLSEFTYTKKKSTEVLSLQTYEEAGTPNGYHVVTDAFDSRELEKKFPDVEIKRDDLLLVDFFEVE